MKMREKNIINCIIRNCNFFKSILDCALPNLLKKKLSLRIGYSAKQNKTKLN